MSTPKFKVGDRVKVVRQSNESAPKGRIGTVMEVSQIPWIQFDDPNPAAYKPLMKRLGIPEGRAGCTHQNNLELITNDTMTDELKVTKAAVLEAASKCSTAKATLQVLFPDAFKKEDEPFEFKEGDKLSGYLQNSVEPIYIGDGDCPTSLSYKCLVVQKGWEMRKQKHCGRTILTFHRKP